jgi:SAM-dependent methyltransferase
MFVDVLHHTDDPEVLIAEAARVARRSIVIKDHTKDGLLAGRTLAFMDWVGNARHGVALPYNYWPRRRWQEMADRRGLRVERWIDRLGLYPWWARWVFERKLHFVARLDVPRPAGASQ